MKASVPNVPCGVEIVASPRISTLAPFVFLMYRVELKGVFIINYHFGFHHIPFLMYRVELKAGFSSEACLTCSCCVPNVPCGVERCAWCGSSLQ